MTETVMVTIVALILLALRVIAVRYLASVLAAQRGLLKRPIDPDIAGFRRDLHHLTIALTISNIPAIVLDVFFVMKGMGLSFGVVSNASILMLYTMSNALTAVISAVLIYRMYDGAAKTDRSHPDADHKLMNDE